MNYLTPDFFEAWRAGGLRAYCYLEATMRYAVACKDFTAAAELDFLQDVLNERTALEVIADMRKLAQGLIKITVREVLVA